MVREYFGRGFEELRLPNPETEVIDGVRWGRADELLSPAYWATQAWLADQDEPPTTRRLGTTLAEEATACILGGHGMPAEMGLAAFAHLRRRGLIFCGESVNASDLHRCLSEKILCGGRELRYRFPRQKATVLAGVLHALGDGQPLSEDHQSFRDWFLRFPGVGPKTASWITRNWLDSDDVAIIDVHVFRASLFCGVFTPGDRPAGRSYVHMERRFLLFAHALGVRASVLDDLIWRQMRRCTSTVLRLLASAGLESPI